MRTCQRVLVALIPGCSLAALAQFGREADQIIELESKWSDMFGERDLDGIMSLMARDSVLIMPGAASIVGIEAIRHATSTMLASDDRVSWKSDAAYVSASGDMAFDYGTTTTELPDGSAGVAAMYLLPSQSVIHRWMLNR